MPQGLYILGVPFFDNFSFSATIQVVWARSSVVERFSDKEEVDGSIPSVPTIT